MLRETDFKGYTFLEKKEISELNGQGYLLAHNKTGARVLLVENDDTNKVFSIAFRTPPADDTGVAHILEHSVLCGSDKFPSKDPFIELAKGSLNTFLNAMTYPDKTVYPIASCNAQDYHNLMHVYLDAVFHPNIYKREEIMKQEGWHYEIESPEGELTFNGVVYNEMKGVFSSPDDVLARKIQSTLLKDTPYAYESGGDPDAIPELTREKFLAFHSKYYHPSNSYIYLYGDVDFKKELAFIDEEYLSHYERETIDSSVARQEPFTAPLTVKDTYSVSEEEEDGIYLSYNVVAGDSCDNEKSIALQILDYVLFGMPGAPVKKCLIDAGLGKDVESDYDNGIRQPIFSVIVKNAPKGKEEAFVRILEKALEEQVASGLNKKAIYSAINSYEFKFREASFGRFPKGLIYGLNFLGSWLYDDAKSMELADSLTPLANLKNKVDTGYFEDLIRTCFLENTHKAYIHLYPEAGKNERMEQKLAAQLAAVKEKLTQKQLHYLVEDTKKLKEFQETPSTEEELAKIPMLSLADIDKKELPYKNEEQTIGGTTAVIHDYHTNGIGYIDFFFDATELPEELVPYASLLVDIYRYVDTEHYSYNELATEINLKVGGIHAGTTLSALYWKKDGYRPSFYFRMKCLEEQIPDGMALLEEILFTSKLDDKKRLKEILSELHTKLDTRIPASGHLYAANRALSYVDPMMAYKDKIDGIGFYEFIKNLDRHFEENADLLVRQLQRTQVCLFRKENLTLSLTGQFNFKSLLEGETRKFNRLLYSAPCVKSVPVLVPKKKNEGFKTASKVQYVASAGCFAKDGQSYHGALNVLKTIFSYDYLWVNVRVTGGAYGCMCSFTRNGHGFFTSYRDPNLSATLETYKKAADYVRHFEAGERDMTKYIIGTISSMDHPMTPAALGMRSFYAYQSGLTEAMIQKERDQVLATDVETIRSLADYIEAMMADETLCAIGNEKKLSEESALFESLESLTQ